MEKTEKREATRKEGARAFQGKRFPLLGKTRGRETLPWLRRLPMAWARELAGRYFCRTFPMHKGVRGKNGRGGDSGGRDGGEGEVANDARCDNGK